MLLRFVGAILLCSFVTPALATVITITESHNFFLSRVDWPTVENDKHKTLTLKGRFHPYATFDPALGTLERVDITLKSTFNLDVKLADVIQKTPSPAGPVPLPYPYIYEVDFAQTIKGRGALAGLVLDSWTRDHHGIGTGLLLTRDYLFGKKLTFGLGELDDFINLDGFNRRFDFEVELKTALYACCGWQAGTGGGIISGKTDHPVDRGTAVTQGTIVVDYTYTEHAPVPTPVPEPGTLSLLAIGFVGSVWVRRRKAAL